MEGSPSVDPAALREEDRRIRTLQWAVSLAVQAIVQAPLSYSQAVAALNGTRALALRLFPGKAFAFDVIYRPRLQRAIAQRFRVN
jgi:hypothetical protein